jgi:ribose 5-phosphate isomerase B
MSIAANKIEGVRAAMAWNEDQVRLTREHNDANILALGAKYLDPGLAGELVDLFLTTQFTGGRHARRIEKIAELERGSGNSTKEKE